MAGGGDGGGGADGTRVARLIPWLGVQDRSNAVGMWADTIRVGEVDMDRFDTALAQFKATNEYRRLERLAYYRAHPDSLAAVRAERAKLNAYLIEQGLPALDDPYPEHPRPGAQ